MKKFKFEYENILKLRIQEEENVKNELSKLRHLQNELKEERAVLKNSLKHYSEALEKTMKVGCCASTYKSVMDDKVFYFNRIEIKDKEILSYEEMIQVLNEELVEKIKARKTMDKLKEKSYDKYLKEYLYEENKIMEEIVNFKSNCRGE